jgi:membrane protease YdiL (CAAX protease family)
MGTSDTTRHPRADLLGTPGAVRQGMSFGTLAPFFALAFGLTWGIFALLIAFPERMASIFGPVGYTNPAFVLAVYSPAVAAFLLVWRHYGLTGVGSFLRRLTLWRMPWPWWLLLVVGIIAVFYVGAMLRGEPFDPFPFSPWFAYLPAAATALIIGPIEEFGWRGVALPLLQRRLTPLWAGIILGAIWAVWHIPAFLVAGTPQSAWAITPFLIGVTVIGVLLVPMFNAARGSLLIAALYHFQMNNPVHPYAQPWDTVIFSLLAVVIVALNWRAMTTRESAVTSVLYPGDEEVINR